MAHGEHAAHGQAGSLPGTYPESGAAHEQEHPGERTYIEVAIVLAIITMVEVAIYYIDWMHDSGLLVPALGILSVTKFVAVVGYFMHLKFDDRRFLWMFASGLAIAVAVLLALKFLFMDNELEVVRTLL